MPFVEADPEFLRKAIEGFQNELKPEKDRLDAFYRQFRCKRCGKECRKETLPGHCFNDPETMTPRAVLRCLMCGFLFDPHSGLAIELGDPQRILGVPIIRSGDE